MLVPRQHKTLLWNWSSHNVLPYTFQRYLIRYESLICRRTSPMIFSSRRCSAVGVNTYTHRPSDARCYSWLLSVSRCHHANREQFTARYQDVTITNRFQAPPQDNTRSFWNSSARSRQSGLLTDLILTYSTYYLLRRVHSSLLTLYGVLVSSHLTLWHLNLIVDDAADDECKL